jgi:hypothetical protein
MDIAPDTPNQGWFNRLSDWWNRFTRFRNDGYNQLRNTNTGSDFGADPINDGFITLGYNPFP